MLASLRRRAKRLNQEVTALVYAQRHPDTPWYARAATLCVVAYALSPIDLIPDFIPVLGVLDDLILLPLGIYLTLKLVPEHVINEARERASTTPSASRWGGAALIVSIWLALLGGAYLLVVR